MRQCRRQATPLPPWSVDDPDTKLGQACFIVRDANGQALAYVYCEDEPGRRAVAKLLTRDEAPGLFRYYPQPDRLRYLARMLPEHCHQWGIGCLGSSLEMSFSAASTSPGALAGAFLCLG